MEGKVEQLKQKSAYENVLLQISQAEDFLLLHW